MKKQMEIKVSKPSESVFDKNKRGIIDSEYDTLRAFKKTILYQRSISDSTIFISEPVVQPFKPMVISYSFLNDEAHEMPFWYFDDKGDSCGVSLNEVTNYHIKWDLASTTYDSRKFGISAYIFENNPYRECERIVLNYEYLG